jgi:REP element-mobilizing transposase RayT
VRKHRPRLETFDYIGTYRYFLTFCTHDRRKLFTDAEVVALVHDQILHAASVHEFAFPAYVYMPDHVHLLAKGRLPSSDLKAFVKLAKQRAGYAYSTVRHGRLWQPSYYDHALRDDEADLPVWRYIAWNPVRSGLVSQPADYPFLGSTTHSVAEIVKMCEELPEEF